MTIKLFSPETKELAKHNNTWKYLTVALGVIVVVGLLICFLVGYFYPQYSIDLLRVGTFGTGIGGSIIGGILAVLAGVLGMLFVIAVPIILLILVSMIIGYGFGIGFSATDLGKAIARRERIK